MERLNLYTSTPPTTRVSLALLGLEATGREVVLHPLSALPPAPPRPAPRLAALRAEFEDVCAELATVGDILSSHENRAQVLDYGTEQGLRYDREALLSRKRGLEAALHRAGGGGPARG